MPAGQGLKTRRQQTAFPARIAAPEQSTRASVVRALPRSAAPLRIGDHHTGNGRYHRGIGGGRSCDCTCLCGARGEYRRATEVTYLGFVYGTMAALKSPAAGRATR